MSIKLEVEKEKRFACGVSAGEPQNIPNSERHATWARNVCERITLYNAIVGMLSHNPTETASIAKASRLVFY